MTVPFYMLKGTIILVKEIRINPTKPYFERHYKDEYGNKAVIIRYDHWRRNGLL